MPARVERLQAIVDFWEVIARGTILAFVIAAAAAIIMLIITSLFPPKQ